MEAKTIGALKGSIEKWRKIAYEGGEDRGTSDCPLCHLYFRNDENGAPVCDGCPVAEHTGQNLCEGSPYDEWTDVAGFTVTGSESKKAAIEELEFLKSLLPEDK